MAATGAGRDPEFDVDRLDAFLRGRIAGLEGPVRLERISGGQSNPTFFVTAQVISLEGALTGHG